jgi:hypothetical protein
MRVEIFTLCDAATVDTANKLNILGSFDRLNAKQEPVTHDQCSLVIKLRFERQEQGEKHVRITFLDSKGAPVMPTIEVTIHIKFDSDLSSANVPLIVAIRELRLPTYGDYSINLALDGEAVTSIPFFARPLTQ